MMDDPVVAYIQGVERRAKNPIGVLRWYEIILVSELGMFRTMEEKCAFLRGMHSMKNLVREEMEQKGIIVVRVE